MYVYRLISCLHVNGAKYFRSIYICSHYNTHYYNTHYNIIFIKGISGILNIHDVWLPVSKEVLRKQEIFRRITLIQVCSR